MGFFARDTRRDVKRPLTTRCRICSACPGCGFLGESAAESDFGISVMNSSQRLRLEEKEEQEDGQAYQLVSHLTSVFYSFVESYNPNSTHEQNLQTQAGSRLLCFVEEHQTTNSEHAQKHRRPQTPTSLRDRVCRTISTHEHTHTHIHTVTHFCELIGGLSAHAFSHLPEHIVSWWSDWCTGACGKDCLSWCNGGPPPDLGRISNSQP